MRPITEVPCECSRCCWDGITGDCEPDEDGNPRCPECYQFVTINYSDEELAGNG